MNNALKNLNVYFKNTLYICYLQNKKNVQEKCRIYNVIFKKVKIK